MAVLIVIIPVDLAHVQLGQGRRGIIRQRIGGVRRSKGTGILQAGKAEGGVLVRGQIICPACGNGAVSLGERGQTGQRQQEYCREPEGEE